MQKYYYNIPSNNRELQRHNVVFIAAGDYNIPSNNRELQLMILKFLLKIIITYQVITGNYSSVQTTIGFNIIITYQVITGNYSKLGIFSWTIEL